MHTLRDTYNFRDMQNLREDSRDVQNLQDMLDLLGTVVAEQLVPLKHTQPQRDCR